MKKSWIKPKLVVLTRGNPEESVLGHCKEYSGDPTGASTAFNACDREDPAPACPGVCESATTT